MPQSQKAKTSNTFKIATINIENIKTNLEYLHHLLSQTDILCVQEHWLYNFEASTAKEYLQGVQCHTKCVDDDDPITPLFKPKGNAGVMTIWKEEMNEIVTTLPDGSSRVIVTQVGLGSKPVFIINSYMPTEGSPTRYAELLDEIFEITEMLQPKGSVVWLGDLNGSFTRPTPSANDKKLSAFCRELCIDMSMDSKPTYHHFVGNIKSRIDHILTLPDSKEVVSSIMVEERHPLNMSSHDPVLATIHLTTHHPATKHGHGAAPAKGKPNWNKIDVGQYQHLTSLRLDSFIQNNGLQLPPEVTVDRLYDILLSSANECGPTPRKAKKRSNKYPWSSEMKPITKDIKSNFHAWKKNGKDPNDPISHHLDQLKKELRSMQRQLAAQHRRDLHSEISDASTENKQLFYKLVQRQRHGTKELCNNVDFGSNCIDQMEGWANYYEELAADKPLPHFDEVHMKQMKMKFHLTCIQDESRCSDNPSHVSAKQISKYVGALKNRKAADVFGLTAEHIKYSSGQIIDILTNLTNTIFKSRKLPDQFKIGALVPCHKKKKPIRNPDSYRRITIASNIGKVVEKHMMARTKPASKAKQDPLQFGFTEDSSPSICALLLTESIAEAKDQKTPLYLSFMDSSKAFDMVDHTILLNSLHDLQLEPHLWYMYKDMYSQVQSQVRINGQLSRRIKEGRGIRQGGETSTEGFKSKENPFLTRVRKNPVSYRIGSNEVGIPTVADDNCMIADSHIGAQTQLIMAQDNAARVRYVFSTQKSKVMIVGSKQPPDTPLLFNHANIEFSSKETHLGLARTADGKATEAVKDRIQVGRRTAYALMGAGMYGVNGISPHVSKKLISVYVDPAVLYGLEALCLAEDDLKALDRYQRQLLRQIQGLPDSTAIPAVYLLLGILPLRAQVHKKILTLYCSIMRKPTTTECEVLCRQLAMKNTSSYSWTSQLRRVLYMYKLPSPIQIANNPPVKDKWKHTTKLAIEDYWENELKEEAAKMKSLKHLNLRMCAMGYTHPVWVCGSDPLQTTMATVKAALLVGRYPLTGSKCAGKKQSSSCPLCNTEEESMAHFLLRCPGLEEHRTSYRTQLQDIFQRVPAGDDEALVRVILDPSHYVEAEDDIIKVEEVTRRYCYTLHNHRSIILGNGSATSRAIKRVTGRGNYLNKQAHSKSKSNPKFPKTPKQVNTLPRGSPA